MGVFSRIGSLYNNVVHRIGTLSVHGVLNRVGQLASAGTKAVSLINHVTGGAVRNAAETYLGSGATNAIVGAGTYLSKMYDQAQMVKAGMGPHGSTVPAIQQRFGGGAGGAATPATSLYSSGFRKSA